MFNIFIKKQLKEILYYNITSLEIRVPIRNRPLLRNEVKAIIPNKGICKLCALL